MNIEVLYEDKNYILVKKPQGMPSQPDKTGDDDVITVCENERNIKGINIINRLDRPVGGVVLLAKNKNAAAEATRLVQENKIKKEYCAVVCGEIKEKEGFFEDFLLKNGKTNTSSVVREETKNAKKARLYYKAEKTITDENENALTLVKIRLETGRHHQIRVQFASRGVPLWGDSKYNEKFAKKRGFFKIALWSEKIEFFDKLGKKEISACCEAEDGVFEKFK